MSDDVTAITQLYARYSHAIDARDHHAFLGCFTSDGRMEIVGGPAFAGPSGLAEVIAARTPSSPRHETSNILVDRAEGERAAARAYFVLRSGQGQPAASGRYEDELVRTSTGWRFGARRITFDWRA